jgi:hypothetical protein
VLLHRGGEVWLPDEAALLELLKGSWDRELCRDRSYAENWALFMVWPVGGRALWR